jgi:hypothetical protein
MGEEAAQRREPEVSGGGGVCALRFEMEEEGFDGLHVEVGEFEFRHRTSRGTRNEAEEELQAIAIGAHGVGARAARALQMLAEERLRQRQQDRAF